MAKFFGHWALKRVRTVFVGPVENAVHPRGRTAGAAAWAWTSDESCHLAVVVAQDAAEALTTGETGVAFQEAAALWEKLIRAQPETLNYRSELGRHNIGQALERQGRVEEALKAYQQSAEHLGVVFTKAPHAKGYRSQLSIVYVKVARLQRDLSRPAEAAVTSAKRRDLWPADARELYQAACELALCVPLVGRGKPILSPVEQAEQRNYADQAVAVLRQAVQAGYRDVAQLKKDLRLDSLRMHAAFNAFLAELEK
jgi:tetratricopeptide (TPR) repeat protein